MTGLQSGPAHGRYYVRHNLHEPFVPRVFQCQQAEKCSVCHLPIRVGEDMVLVPLGPGDDPEERRKAFAGEGTAPGGGWYNAVAVLAHKACSRGES